MLVLEDVGVEFRVRHGLLRAVEGVSLTVEPGEITGIVGESGSGKSTLLQAVMGLLPPKAALVHGSINLDGREITSLSRGGLRALRGKEVAMVFQDPMTALNPFYRVGRQIEEAMLVHGAIPAEPAVGGRRERCRHRALKLMAEVGIADPEQRYDQHPHQFSGGMQQRILIAIALACEPGLLLLDEPTTALDVTIQAQIIELLREINRTRGTSMVLVTHNLAMAAEMCGRIAVMYAGELVEVGPASDVLRQPTHPYTQGLLRSLPRYGVRRAELEIIPGSAPSLRDRPPGCPFAPRCREVVEECHVSVPALVDVGAGRLCRCLRRGGVR
ncbi:MAG: ABC transporter ATP-binding protein [Thermoleophilia bacterium]